MVSIKFKSRQKVTYPFGLPFCSLAASLLNYRTKAMRIRRSLPGNKIAKPTGQLISCRLLIGSLLLLLLLAGNAGAGADDTICELLQLNRQQETAITPLLARATTTTSYAVYQDFLRNHPENICLHRAMLRKALTLGYSRQLRQFYLGQLRQWQIRWQQPQRSAKVRIALISLHHFAGCLYQRLYSADHAPNHAYLALSHFSQALSFSQDYLPAWLRAWQMLQQMSGEKNAASVRLCRYHIHRLWHSPEYNPTYFRIYPDEIVFQQPPTRPEMITPDEAAPAPPGGITVFLEEMTGLARWLPANDIGDVRLSLEIAHHYYHKSKKQPLVLATRTLKQALSHAQESLARLQSVQARGIQPATTQIEPVLRRYLAGCYYRLQLYALAEEQQFIITAILQAK